MTYLLIFVVVFVALSPLLSMMPTRQQRRLANLRQAAAISGLYVQFDAGGDEGQPREILYGCRRQRGDRSATPGIYRLSDGDWAPSQGQWAAERVQALADLPGGVSEIRDDSGGISVIWDETGEPEDVEAIARVLRGMLGRNY